MKVRLPALAAILAVAAGCGGVFESDLPSSQAYVLRLPPRAATTPVAAPVGSVLLQRPESGPGLDSDRIAVLRSDRRFDVYAASRWAAPAPDLVSAVIVDGLRATGAFAAVFDDSAPFAPQYDLRVTLRRFEADYTAGDSPPSVYVTLDCTIARHRDRVLLGTFTAQGAARASEDRLSAVVGAFEAAMVQATGELERATLAAVASEPSAPRAPAPSESR
jgi:cholesterol transport system auxiliary component